MGELAALRPARGPARVDQRGQAVGVQRLPACLELAVGDVGAGLGERADGVVLDHVDRPELGRLVPDGVDGGGVLVALDDHRGGAGVRQDPRHLVGAGGLVDRDDDRAGGPDGVVEDRPLVAGLGLERDAVTCGHAGRDEPLRDAGDLAGELRPRDVLPLAAAAAPQPHLGAGLGYVGGQHVGQRLVGADLGGHRNAEFAHAWSSPPRRPRGTVARGPGTGTSRPI